MNEAILFPGQGAQCEGMGSDWAAAHPEARETFAEADELPQHDVTLTRAFAMQATEVTQSQWLDLMGNEPAGSTLGYGRMSTPLPVGCRPRG